MCFIKTTNLDGESNLKIRRPVDCGVGDGKVDDASVMALKGLLQCEPPNANLHQFQGRFESYPGGQPSGRRSLSLLCLQAHSMTSCSRLVWKTIWGMLLGKHMVRRSSLGLQNWFCRRQYTQ